MNVAGEVTLLSSTYWVSVDCKAIFASILQTVSQRERDKRSRLCYSINNIFLPDIFIYIAVAEGEMSPE